MRLSLLSFVIASGPLAAWACSCAPPPAPAAALAAAAVVVEAKVVAGPTAEGGAEAPALSGMGPVRYEFEPIRGWKGTPGARFSVQTNGHSAACGRSYASGTTWLLYLARGDDGTLMDSLCSRTRASDGAAEDFAALGAPGEAVQRPTPTGAGDISDAAVDAEQAAERAEVIGADGGAPTPSESGAAAEPAVATSAPPAPAADSSDDEPDPGRKGCDIGGGLWGALLLVGRRRR